MGSIFLKKPIMNPIERTDRLSALMERFSLTVQPADGGEANMVVLGRGDVAERVVLRRSGDCPLVASGAPDVLFAACVDWGGALNPLFAAVPEVIDCPAEGDLAPLATLLVAEHRARRCGAASVLNRLAEVIVVRLMRRQIEAGSAEPGRVGGLADPQISRAIVAMHDAPGRAWRNGDLAEVAGLSPSRFAERFVEAVGQTPAAYLRTWRLTLARQDLERGERVQTVAHRYAYGSSEALGRAYRRAFGESPAARRV